MSAVLTHTGFQPPKAKFALGVLALGLALAGVTVLGLIRRSSVPNETAPAALVREAARTNLVLREGQLWSREQEPFSGWMVEYFADGTARSRSAVANGLLHGLSRGYYTNAQLQVTEYFVAGVSEGVRTKWYPNGIRQSEAPIAGGKLQGTYRKWHENGVLAEEVEFAAGQPEGVAWSYYPSGCRKGRVVLEQGRAVAQQFWRDGEEKP